LWALTKGAASDRDGVFDWWLVTGNTLLLLVTPASDLPLLRTFKFCFLLFVVVVHAGCDKFTDAWR